MRKQGPEKASVIKRKQDIKWMPNGTRKHQEFEKYQEKDIPKGRM